MAEHEEKGKKKKWTHAVHTVAARKGGFTHHHEMKDHPDDPHTTMHEHVATSMTPEEAGQHVTDTMAQNEPEEAEGAAPGAAPGAAAEPEAEPGAPEA